MNSRAPCSPSRFTGALRSFATCRTCVDCRVLHSCYRMVSMSWFKRDKGEDDKLPHLGERERKVRTEVLWQKCEGCRQIIWKKDLEGNWNVCPKCGAHSRIDASTRLRLLLDDEEYTRHDSDLRSSDPLGFVDSKPYRDRLAVMQQATNLGDA